MSNKFKEMKFWVGDDSDLFLRVVNALKTLGYTCGDGLFLPDKTGGIRVHDGRVYWTSDFADGKEYFDRHVSGEEINIDWMRTPNEETVELNGKKYLKSELEEALKHIKPMG